MTQDEFETEMRALGFRPAADRWVRPPDKFNKEQYVAKDASQDLLGLWGQEGCEEVLRVMRNQIREPSAVDLLGDLAADVA